MAKNYLEHVVLDSVHIDNLTQGNDTTLYEPDTVLVIDYVSNVEDSQTVDRSSFHISQNFPNPFKERTEVLLYLSKKETIHIIVCDIVGSELLSFKQILGKGIHTFSFLAGNSKYYLFTVMGEQASKTIKMINTSGINASKSKCRMEYSDFDNLDTEYKFQLAIAGFVFKPGDELKYTAYTEVGELSIIDTPTGDKTYEFQYTGSPCSSNPTVTDIEGNTYNTVLIGEQCWMKENLKTTTYNNGIAIPNVTDSIEWGNIATGAYVWYDNDISWKDFYGALYNWYTTIDTNKICPAGWHVPSHDEWLALTDFIGGWIPPYGDMLKSCRQVNSPLGGKCDTSAHPRWDEHVNYYGTDDFGFSGLPGGNRYFDNGPFTFIGELGFYWSTTEFPQVENAARLSGLLFNYDIVAHSYRHKNDGFSIRCLKD